jgi:4-(gamma-glutamylamino)butanal dehydrogenase
MRRAGIDRLRAWTVPPQCHLIAGRAAESRDRARTDVAFTRSGPMDRLVLEASARSNLKRVHLELGGKSANVAFADSSDLKVSGQSIFSQRRSGLRRGLSAACRAFDPRRLARCRSAMKVGDPLRRDTDIGAVVSEAQIERKLDFVVSAKGEGARLVCGGQRILKAPGGTSMEPTVLADVAPAARLFQEEVFGPILAVTPFEDEAEAIRLANATRYALAGAVWTAHLARAHRMVSALRAAIVHVNTYGGADITVPLGGFGQSGFGRDKSLHAFDSCTDLKTAWIAL